uniref:Exocyst complex component 5 n=1 Tax=Timema tahoe TaxID=61484 RepID=A0A7R9IS25_9NEOP|nr:unnamed protein product [Timema tahoe]
MSLFQELDERINYVAAKVIHLGDQLESVNTPRARAVEAQKLMNYFAEFLSPGPLLAQIFTDKGQIDEAADIIQKLHLIAQELPSGKFEKAKKKIASKYDEIERSLIEEFVKAHRSADIGRMKEIATILSHFKGYSQCVDAFIEQSQMGAFAGKDVFRDVIPLCEKNFAVMKEVFNNPDQVMAKYVLNIYHLKLQSNPGASEECPIEAVGILPNCGVDCTDRHPRCVWPLDLLIRKKGVGREHVILECVRTQEDRRTYQTGIQGRLVAHVLRPLVLWKLLNAIASELSEGARNDHLAIRNEARQRRQRQDRYEQRNRLGCDVDKEGVVQGGYMYALGAKSVLLFVTCASGLLSSLVMLPRTVKLSNDLLHFDMGSDNTFLSKLTRNIFQKYLDSYISVESKCLKEKSVSVLHKYYSLKNHQKKPTQAGG